MASPSGVYHWDHYHSHVRHARRHDAFRARAGAAGGQGRRDARPSQVHGVLVGERPGSGRLGHMQRLCC